MLDVHPQGAVAHDDSEVQAAMEVIDGFRPSERRELTCSAYRAALAFQRTGDAAHATRFATDLLATVHLRGIPAYAEALCNESGRPSSSGAALRVEDVLARLTTTDVADA
ncbi:hypothetical protein [Streptosporangium lutulentum]|uniref:Uncharacterized protein n=1 Tax=Streptosporangium lutulentum TaxID=1461250 RepID=A0ABT9QVI6_9ACTN|nr:hypothetical protein [Streptosporangium lutulentum]MDP9850308.1 hypothetical protein [Streptosporangium lutulentum]